MAMPLPPPPRPPLGRGWLVGVGPLPPAAASQAHRPMLLASLQLLRCRCQRSEGSWRRTTTNGRRRWWSDEDMEEEEEEEEYEYDDGVPGGSAQELFGEPWFSKLFRAYGYVLPLLLLSMLVATGPRAFLMAMALPLAQSAISWTASFFTTRSRRQQQEQWYGYQYDDLDFKYRDEENDDYHDAGAWQWQSRSHQQPNKSGSSFGGWDDLLYDDKEKEKEKESTRKRTTPPESDTAAAAAADLGLRTRRDRRRSNGGMSRGRRRSSSSRYNQAPLLTRLLVALFPFLGSWFRIL